MARTHLDFCPVCDPERRKASGYAPAHYDGHGIFLFYACEPCYDMKIKGYRSDILEPYECDEPLEAE